MATLTMRQIASYCYAAGFRGNALITATAVAMAESSGRTDVVNYLGCTGLFQIYIKVHIRSNPSWTTKAMKQPYNNAKAAYKLSSGGRNWRPWEAYTKGMHKKYLPAARVAAQQTIAAKGGNGGKVPTTTRATPTPSGPTVSKALSIARREIGYRASGGNTTKFHTAMGLTRGQPWCACFTSWVLWKAGFSKAELRKMLGKNIFKVFSIRDHAKKIGRWKSKPKPGYLVVFSYSHIEIVEKVLGTGYIQTIGGNTSSGNRGSQNNGRGVWRRKRSTRQVMGYVQIPYDAGNVNQTPMPDVHYTASPEDDGDPAPTPDIDSQGILNENGVWNTATALEFAKYAGIGTRFKTSAQYWRNFEAKAGFPIKFQDGELDHETIQYLQWFTHQKKLTGIWDAATIRGVQRHLNKVKQESSTETI